MFDRVLNKPVTLMRILSLVFMDIAYVTKNIFLYETVDTFS